MYFNVLFPLSFLQIPRISTGVEGNVINNCFGNLTGCPVSTFYRCFYLVGFLFVCYYIALALVSSTCIVVSSTFLGQRCSICSNIDKQYRTTNEVNYRQSHITTANFKELFLVKIISNSNQIITKNSLCGVGS